MAASPCASGCSHPTKCRLNQLLTISPNAPSSPWKLFWRRRSPQSKASCSTPGNSSIGARKLRNLRRGAEQSLEIGICPLIGGRNTMPTALASIIGKRAASVDGAFKFRVFLMTNLASIFELSTDCLPHNERIAYCASNTDMCCFGLILSPPETLRFGRA